MRRRLFVAWFRGLTNAEARTDHDYSLAWAVIIGLIPVAIVGFLGKNLVSVALRSLWVVAALILWSGVMWVAEMRHTRLLATSGERGEGTSPSRTHSSSASSSASRLYPASPAPVRRSPPGSSAGSTV